MIKNLDPMALVPAFIKYVWLIWYVVRTMYVGHTIRIDSGVYVRCSCAEPSLPYLRLYIANLSSSSHSLPFPGNIFVVSLKAHNHNGTTYHGGSCICAFIVSTIILYFIKSL